MAAPPPVCGQPVVRVVCQPVRNQNRLPQHQMHQIPRVGLAAPPGQGFVRSPTPSQKEVLCFSPRPEARSALASCNSSPQMPVLLRGRACVKPAAAAVPLSPRVTGNFRCDRSPSHRHLPSKPDSLTSSSDTRSSAGSPVAKALAPRAAPRPSDEAAAAPAARALLKLPGTSRRDHDVEVTTARVAEFLTHREYLKAEVVRTFKRIAANRTSINIRGLQNFKTLLAQATGVPLEALGNLQTTYIRFDFDGDGRLDFNEAYKLVKHHLWMYLKKHGGVSQADVPHKSLDQAGFRVTKELGRGSQGVAMLATDATGQEWCVKCYEKGKMSCGGLSELRDELETMQRLSCDLIAHLCECFQDDRFYYTVGEAYYGGDLSTLRQRAEQEGVETTEQWWRTIFRQCFQALAFMHENAMMHCDIKEPNIMVKKNDFSAPEIVLIDFGVSKAMAADDNGKVYGTPGYIPPETFEMKMWFPGGDVFSMGVCALQVVGGQVPSTTAFKPGSMRGVFIEGCTTLREIMQATLAREPPFHWIPESMPGLEHVVRKLLQKQMALRPRAPRVLQEPWFCADLDPSSPTAQEAIFNEHMLGTMGISDALYQSF